MTVSEKQKLKWFIAVLAIAALFINYLFYSHEKNSRVFVRPQEPQRPVGTTTSWTAETRANISTPASQNVIHNNSQNKAGASNPPTILQTNIQEILEVAGFQPWPADWKPTQFFSPARYVETVLYTEFLIKPTDVVCCEIPHGCHYHFDSDFSRLEPMEGSDELGRKFVKGIKFPPELAEPLYVRLRLKNGENTRVFHVSLIRDHK